MADEVNLQGIERMIALLQDIHIELEDVVTAPRELDEYPIGEIGTVDMPMVLVFPEPGSWRQESFNSLIRQDRNFSVMVFVAKHMQGVQTETLRTTVQMMQRFGDAYTDRDNQLLQATPSQITMKASAEFPVLDGGYDDQLSYLGHDYIGFEFIVGVYEKV